MSQTDYSLLPRTIPDGHWLYRPSLVEDTKSDSADDEPMIRPPRRETRRERIGLDHTIVEKLLFQKLEAFPTFLEECN